MSDADDSGTVTSTIAVSHPVMAANDQFAAVKAADDWKPITSLEVMNDQFTVVKCSFTAVN